MNRSSKNDAVVVGSGPNGLAAAITLVKAGLEVTVYEKNDVPGGACRSTELIQPGCIHDLGSSVHPLAIHSPFFRSVDLEKYGLTWITPDYALAHPLDDGTAAAVAISIDETIATIENSDRDKYRNLMTPLARNGSDLIRGISYFPSVKVRNPLLMMRFGLKALCSTKRIATGYFNGNRTGALFTGLGVHSVIDQQKPGSIAAGLVLAAAAHMSGWVLPAGGAQKVTDAMIACLAELGGTVITNHEVTSLGEFKHASIIMMDTTPQQFVRIAGDHLPASCIRRMSRYHYGPGVYKIDWILSDPVPWNAESCRQAGTIHLGGSSKEIIAAEDDVFHGKHPDKPFVMLSQPSLFDNTRTPDNRHILWGYCHVPGGSSKDMSERIENQIERFAPGFKETILDRNTMDTAAVESDNPNCVMGDITGGSQSLKRMLLPDATYHTPIDNVFLCSSSTPPGPGVHGMCGYRAALSALRKYKIRQT